MPEKKVVVKLKRLMFIILTLSELIRRRIFNVLQSN